MGTRKPQVFVFPLLYFLLATGSSITDDSNSMQNQVKHLESQANPMNFPSTIELEEIPIFNPTTPIGNPNSPLPPPPMTNPNTTPISASPNGSWCIANPSSSETALQVAIDYACGYGGADCTEIQPGGSCYIPNAIPDHASFAFNDYYQKHPGPTSCVFGGTAQISATDPSSGSCHYSSSTQTSPALPTPSTIPTAPSIPPPFSQTSPDGQTIYGSEEPSGNPSFGTTNSCNLLLLSATTFLIVLLIPVENLKTAHMYLQE